MSGSSETPRALAPASGETNPLRRLRAYEQARRVVDDGWPDVQRLAAHAATRLVAEQLLRSLGSIAANIAEGYGRSTGPDRARFFEYALGSARESCEWYRTARHVLGNVTTNARLAQLDLAIALLVGLTRRARGRGYRADGGRPSGFASSQ